MKKFLCAALCAILACSAMTGCDKKDKPADGQQMVGNGEMSDDLNIQQDDMPYGAMLIELLPENDEKIQYIIDFDKRYFGGDMDNPDYSEIYLIHDYIVGLNENDHEKIKSLYYPGYLEKVCEINGYSSTDEYLNSLITAMRTLLGEDFVIDYIDVSNCYNENDDIAATYFTQAAKIINDFDASLNEKITSRKIAEVGGYTCYSKTGGSFQLTNYCDPILLRIFNVDGKYYLF